MNKNDLVSSVAEETTLKKSDVEKVINSLFNSIKDSLAQGEKVTVVGFGTFDVVERKARDGINPKTGDKIKIPATKAPKFKAGKGLKEAVK